MVWCVSPFQRPHPLGISSPRWHLAVIPLCLRMLQHRATWGSPGKLFSSEHIAHPSRTQRHLNQPWGRSTPVHHTPRNTGEQIHLVRSQAQKPLFLAFLIFPPFFRYSHLVFPSLQRTSNLHFSLALYTIRPDSNRPGFKCIITTRTLITIKHSFNGNKQTKKNHEMGYSG